MTKRNCNDCDAKFVPFYVHGQGAYNLDKCVECADKARAKQVARQRERVAKWFADEENKKVFVDFANALANVGA